MVVDPCPYGREGLVTALCEQPSQQGGSVTGYASLNLASQAWWPALKDGLPGCLVVRLPDSPQVALATVLQLAVIAARLADATRLVVLSSFSSAHILRVLSVMGVRQRVCVAGTRLPVASLCELLSAAGGVDRGDVPAMWATVTLSPREREVLCQSVLAVAVARQARRHTLSSKTLYAQRRTALRKLGADHLHGLLVWFQAPQGERRGRGQRGGRVMSTMNRVKNVHDDRGMT
jgi:DNA-binding CsgD family transcriptional regulator